MSELIIQIVPQSKAEFLRWIRRLGSIPDAYKAVTRQPYLTGKDAWKKAMDWMTKELIVNEVSELLDDFQNQQLIDPLTKEEVAMKLSELIVRPDVKPTDSIKAIESLIKLNSWEIKKQEVVTAKADFQSLIKNMIDGDKALPDMSPNIP